ncbi:heme exporter protein CcmD [Methylibium sp.]|uniref:heme exporter protein CcmD n=1 Tax=Methylibium sp. TaxID=2067992 RepID=UPI003D1458BA
MEWHSASAFFDMGGYGLYVWGSYAVTALLMAAEPWLAARRQRQALERACEAPDSDLPA